MIGGGGVLGDLLFGSGGTDPEAFRSPGWEQQGEFLNDYMMGQFMTPEMMDRNRQRIAELQQQSDDWQRDMEASPIYGGAGGRSIIGGQNPYTEDLLNAQDRLSRMEGAQQFRSPQFTPGQAIAGQIAPTTTALQDYDVNFKSRNPFQFSNFNFQNYDPRQAVGDAFTPQFEMAQRNMARQGGLERDAILEDMNSRGMLTTGGTTQALMKQREAEGNRLANLAGQLATQQGQQQLQSTQFGANLNNQRQGMELGRQQAQAGEIFRQQGASDSQAQFLAQNALQKRNQQMQNQGQLFNQKLGGRQAALGEYGIQQQSRRQPMNDLFRLYQLSAGSQPGMPGTPGLIGQAAQGFGQGIGMTVCLPKGSQVETESGFKKIEDIIPGDEVVGGKVLITSRRLRDSGHVFYRHTFDGGEVIMSKGHPYYDELKGIESVQHDSKCTYDIKTTDGYYFVNGIKLGSTIGG